MRKLLATTSALFALIIAIWALQSFNAGKPTPDAAPPVARMEKPQAIAPRRAVSATPPAPAAPPRAAQPEDESYAAWREIFARHDAHPEGTEAWKEQSLTKLTNYYSKVNDALALDATHVAYIPVLKGVDCRDKSCVMELEFQGFAQAMAYFEMVQTGRMKYDYQVGLNFDCPPKRTALPRTPGQPYPVPFRALFQFECEDEATEQTANAETVGH